MGFIKLYVYWFITVGMKIVSKEKSEIRIIKALKYSHSNSRNNFFNIFKRINYIIKYEIKVKKQNLRNQRHF